MKRNDVPSDDELELVPGLEWRKTICYLHLDSDKVVAAEVKGLHKKFDWVRAGDSIPFAWNGDAYYCVTIHYGLIK